MPCGAFVLWIKTRDQEGATTLTMGRATASKCVSMRLLHSQTSGAARTRARIDFFRSLRIEQRQNHSIKNPTLPEKADGRHIHNTIHHPVVTIAIQVAFVDSCSRGNHRLSIFSRSVCLHRCQWPFLYDRISLLRCLVIQ